MPTVLDKNNILKFTPLDVLYTKLGTTSNLMFQKNAVECVSLLVEDYQSRSAIKALNGSFFFLVTTKCWRICFLKTYCSSCLVITMKTLKGNTRKVIIWAGPERIICRFFQVSNHYWLSSTLHTQLFKN